MICKCIRWEVCTLLLLFPLSSRARPSPLSPCLVNSPLPNHLVFSYIPPSCHVVPALCPPSLLCLSSVRHWCHHTSLHQPAHLIMSSCLSNWEVPCSLALLPTPLLLVMTSTTHLYPMYSPRTHSSSCVHPSTHPLLPSPCCGGALPKNRYYVQWTPNQVQTFTCTGVCDYWISLTLGYWICWCVFV